MIITNKPRVNCFSLFTIFIYVWVFYNILFNCLLSVFLGEVELEKNLNEVDANLDFDPASQKSRSCFLIWLIEPYDLNFECNFNSLIRANKCLRIGVLSSTTLGF